RFSLGILGWGLGMHGNFDNTQKTLQLQEIKTDSNKNQKPVGTPPVYSNGSGHEAWVTAFNTSLLTTRAKHIKDRSAELGELMQTPEFQSLLIAAQHLAQTQGYSKEVATERLIDVFRRIDYSWK